MTGHFKFLHPKIADGLVMLSKRHFLYLLLIMFAMVQLVLSEGFAAVSVSYGSQDIGQSIGTIGGNVVQAYTRTTVDRAVTITSVSLYLEYDVSDGSQCIKFGVYRDDGYGSPAGQPLVAATQNGYCFYTVPHFGPAWQTWQLAPSDYLVIRGPGVYWLTILARQGYGSVYHYAYYGPNGRNFFAYSYYFYLSGNPNWIQGYDQGFPGVFNSSPNFELSNPYSFYVTGSAA